MGPMAAMSMLLRTIHCGSTFSRFLQGYGMGFDLTSSERDPVLLAGFLDAAVAADLP